VRPKTVLIDGGIALYFSVALAVTNYQNPSAVVQTKDQGFDFNGESDLDLQYAMSLTDPQTVTLLQTGDLVEGELIVYSSQQMC
jgi:hypothetical protein